MHGGEASALRAMDVRWSVWELSSSWARAWRQPMVRRSGAERRLTLMLSGKHTTSMEYAPGAYPSHP